MDCFRPMCAGSLRRKRKIRQRAKLWGLTIYTANKGTAAFCRFPLREPCCRPETGKLEDRFQCDPAAAARPRGGLPWRWWALEAPCRKATDGRQGKINRFRLAV